MRGWSGVGLWDGGKSALKAVSKTWYVEKAHKPELHATSTRPSVHLSILPSIHPGITRSDIVA